MNDFKIGEVFIIEFADRVGHADKERMRDAIGKILKSSRKPEKGEYNFYSKYVGGRFNKSELWKNEMKKFEE